MTEYKPCVTPEEMKRTLSLLESLAEIADGWGKPVIINEWEASTLLALCDRIYGSKYRDEVFDAQNPDSPWLSSKPHPEN